MKTIAYGKLRQSCGVKPMFILKIVPRKAGEKIASPYQYTFPVKNAIRR